MDKLRMQTANKADENFKKLAAMFPNAVTETINENGEVVRAIDKDVLMQEISCKVVDGNEERYQFTWPDKKKSVLLANAPINKTLRPVREDETVPTGADSEGKPYCSTGSVDFDTTENLYIADYLLVGRASGGWQFIFVEFENPYGRITLADGNPGEVIRKGLNQIDEWKPFIEGCYSTLSAEFEKYTVQDLPREFTRFDSTRMHYVVVAGRRADYNETTRLFQRRSEAERNIKILHYDNILDDARDLIGAKTY